MSSIAISVQNVSKKFKLFNSPKQRLWEILHPFNKKYHREFWALKDINFEVASGSTVGIIGRNGAGKSTLLQIICSILQPSSGKIIVNGRVSSLLELGAGFNPEFTGRDNVLLKGALMGFSLAEMKDRLPLIESFAEVGEFIDQPVKVYSSGMFVRLAFATAINVNPEILVVDEVLAVGDAKFQYKCFNKFLEFQHAGKTIIFVTHDMNAVTKHCDYAVLLEEAAIVESGKPNDVVNQYIDLVERDLAPKDLQIRKVSATLPEETVSKPEESKLGKFLEEIPATDNCIYRDCYNKNECRQGNRRAEILDYLIVNEGKYYPLTIRSGSTIDIYLKVKYNQDIEFPLFGFALKTIDGITVYGTNTGFNGYHIQPAKENDIAVVKFSIKLNLQPGYWFVDLGVGEILKNKEIIAVDRRCGVVCLCIGEKNSFTGFVELESNFQEVKNLNKH